MKPRTNYGVDAPGVLAGLAVGGIAETGLAVILFGVGWVATRGQAGDMTS
ncbi:hypothetical protein [Microbispora triticiradicis]|nr:hypothetical protein [Microbispora triticiradicis]MBO4269466.1 hypothetical protein [Microbispora triticiradicis]